MSEQKRRSFLSRLIFGECWVEDCTNKPEVFRTCQECMVKQMNAHEKAKNIPAHPVLPSVPLDPAATTVDSAFESQEGGDHYKHLSIQPVEFCQRNNLDYCEANVVKYVCRHHNKDGAADIRKAIHYLELLLEIEYPGQ